jgi:hypothetical protein
MEALISCRGFEGGRAPPYTWREWSGKSAAHKGHSDMIPLMTLSTSRRHAMRSLYMIHTMMSRISRVYHMSRCMRMQQR